MSVKLLSGTCASMESSIIEVEVNITKGLPSFCIDPQLFLNTPIQMK